MKSIDYEKAFSRARLHKYLKACNGNPIYALELYRNNIKLCQKFYGVLNIFEVVLRNAINEHYKVYFDDSDWIRHQLVQGGMLENHPQRNAIEQLLEDLDKNCRYTNDRVVSSVTFGFWTHLFSRRPYALGGKSLLRIFSTKTKGLGQRTIYNELQTIKEFRNRIAHHESICFDTLGNISTFAAKYNYALSIKYIRFLGYQDRHLFFRMDVNPIKNLKDIEKAATDGTSIMKTIHKILKNTIFKILFESAEIATFSPAERIKYTEDMTTERDIRNQLAYAKDKGKEEGIALGEAKGKSEAKAEAARAMLKEDLPMDIIVKCTGLSVEEINKL